MKSNYGNIDEFNSACQKEDHKAAALILKHFIRIKKDDQLVESIKTLGDSPLLLDKVLNCLVKNDSKDGKELANILQKSLARDLPSEQQTSSGHSKNLAHIFL